MPKDLVERECSTLFSSWGWGRRETLLASTHTENFCTSYHGNINLEERNRAVGSSILKPFWKGNAQKYIQKGRDWRLDLCGIRHQMCLHKLHLLTRESGRSLSHPWGTAFLASPSPWPTCQALSRAPGLLKHHIAALIPAQNMPAPFQHPTHPRQSQSSCPAESCPTLLRSLRRRTQALKPRGDPSYSEAKVLHPRIHLQLSLSKVPWNSVGWGNFAGLLMNFPHMQFLHISFCSKSRIHESICIGFGIHSFPFTNTIIFTTGWWLITRECGRGVLLEHPANSVMCFLQVPGAHMLQVQGKVKRLRKKPQHMYSFPSSRRAPVPLCVWDYIIIQLKRSSTDGDE